jgi:hypothetical protein
MRPGDEITDRRDEGRAASLNSRQTLPAIATIAIAGGAWEVKRFAPSRWCSSISELLRIRGSPWPSMGHETVYSRL